MNVLVLGVSTNTERYAAKAVFSLKNKEHQVIAFGKEKGSIHGEPIVNNWDPNWQVDTVTLYINPSIQKSFYENIIDLKPKRVIFNPGTENKEFQDLLSKENIQFEEACTLVMLSIGVF